MADFNNRKFGNDRGGRKFGGGGDFAPRRFTPRDGGRDFGRGGDRPQLHDAVCGECGKDCKVPFAPSQGKPVYCSDCFEKRGNGEDRGRRSFAPSRSFGPPAGENDNKKFDIITVKLDKILKLLKALKLEEVAQEELKPQPTEEPAPVAKPKKAKKVAEVVEEAMVPETPVTEEQAE